MRYKISFFSLMIFILNLFLEVQDSNAQSIVQESPAVSSSSGDAPVERAQIDIESTQSTPVESTSNQKNVKKKRKKVRRVRRRGPTWEPSYLTHIWLHYSQSKLPESPLVSYGSPFAQSEKKQGILLQENFSLQKNTKLIVFRPSIESKNETYSLFPLEDRKSVSKVDGRLNELYYQEESSSELIWALGLQNYQWGPAEFLSPSNPLFHFSHEAQEPMYQARGHTLLRLNYSPSGSWSLVSLFEVAPNEEKEFIYKAPFEPKGLLKGEFRFSNPTDYAGLTIGKEQKGDLFIGEYANVTFDEVFSVYFDLKQTQVSHRYYPHIDYGQIPRMNLHDYHDSVYMLSLIGIRWEEEDFDFRWEEVSNELGFSNADMEMVAASMLMDGPFIEDNQKSFLYSGRELPSKGYSYFSLRLPNLISWLDSSVTLRGIQSHRDNSGQGTLHWEGTAGDHWTFFLNAKVAYGKKGSEMRTLFDNQGNAGLQFIW